MRAIDFYIEKIPKFESMTFEERRYWIEFECLERVKKHTKSTLKSLFRVKPKKDEKPAGQYKNEYKNYIDLFYFCQCEPMKNRSTKPRSEAQQLAASKLAAKSMLNSRLARAGKEAYELLRQKPLFLDSETTGLGELDQILQLGICDANGCVFYDKRIKPTVSINPDAQRVHGISKEELNYSPTWFDIVDEVESILKGRKVVIFNQNFDFRMLLHSSDAHKLDTQWIYDLNTTCAMKLAVKAFGSTNRYGSISLYNAICEANLDWEGTAHSAIIDAKMTAKLVNRIAQYYTDALQEINGDCSGT